MFFTALYGESLYLAKQTAPAPASGTRFHHEAIPSLSEGVTEATVTDVSPGRKENPRLRCSPAVDCTPFTHGSIDRVPER